ncbi:hypothetical protein [Terriglobus roseus]|uniref:Uncharacterized protein n=1 Tax=Terriglobus roseus TaxID=392734 RepID=A0A1H4P3N3_9BACT|nr:hypothetical protein [Terriglobus roseus]SEC02051.1 hypothetical protein SAMN05443244_2443 [Terriglobus roseus]
MRLSRLIGLFVAVASAAAQTQADGGIGMDGAGKQVLESIHVPPIAGAPFSLTLATEWTRPLLQGGTFTVENVRPIKRDSRGRIYEERWLLSPKGSNNMPSRRSYIQIYDPTAETFYECADRTHICELYDWPKTQRAPEIPIRTESGPLPDGRGFRTREDRGVETFAGLPVHSYRDTVVLNPGVMGNDRPMTYVRDLRYSEALHFNLSSILQTPTVGEQRFRVLEIVTTEPEAKWFEVPEGYRVVDKRQAAR